MACFRARIAGCLYLVVIAAGIFAELAVRSSLVVKDDAAATARNILSAEPLYRSGVVADIAAALAYAGVALLLYHLLKPVSRSLSGMAAYFGLAGSAIMALNLANLIAPLAYLHLPESTGGMGAHELESLAMVSLKVHRAGYGIATIFFGVHLAFLGRLILLSKFIPHRLGILLAVAGPCYILNSLAGIAQPAFAAHLFPYSLLPGLVGEAALAVWLVMRGDKASRRCPGSAAAEEWKGPVT